ncbi:DUF86 domain-containing protein [Ornithinibacillus contaminans]|uniref:DUF86 domain-containing protein n=1 Tax=Ornithinibacillus contaminans TaxID=694055 RepID=UPI00064DFCD3|nr:DUF86 domain-containing protein [Ornithinibacillus contaminans]
MYFVDRKKVEETLQFIEKLLAEKKSFSTDSFLEKLAFERLAQLLVEAIIDVGNMMIDGFIMRDPGSYEDIIDILIDERVIPTSQGDAYKEVIALRKMLVNDYLHVDYKQLHETLMEYDAMLNQFTLHIRNYLTNELGVANAFTTEE